MPRAALTLLLAVVVVAGARADEDRPQVVCDQQADRVVFRASNPTTYPVTLRIEVDSLDNLRPSVALPTRLTLPAGARDEAVLTLKPVDRNARWRYGAWRSRTRAGRHDAAHDARHVYELPYPPGYAFWIVQGVNGDYSHQGERAYDFDLPEGTPIHAARGGRVVYVKQDSTRHGEDPSFAQYANHVWIEHDDGTLGRYLHIKHGGARVRVGQRVQAGVKIALSGNTGFSRAPHLHFEVAAANRDVDGLQTFPTRFRTDAGPNVELTPRTSPMRPDGRRTLPRNALRRLLFTLEEPIVEQPVKALTHAARDARVLFVAEIGARRAYDVEFRFYRGGQGAPIHTNSVKTQADWDRVWVTESLPALDLRGQPCRVEVYFDGAKLGEAELHLRR